MSDRDHGDVVVLAPVARSLDNLSGFTSAYRTRAVEAEEFSALVVASTTPSETIVMTELPT